MPGGKYVDSRGIEMDHMSFSRALDIIHAGALNNEITATDIAFGDVGLADERDWRNGALATLAHFIENHRAEIDSRPYSNVARQWPDSVLEADRESDPTRVIDAIRICLDMAVQSFPSPSDVERRPDLFEGIELDYQAVDVVSDFVGLNREWLMELGGVENSMGMRT